MRSFSVGSPLTKDTLASHRMFSRLGLEMEQTSYKHFMLLRRSGCQSHASLINTNGKMNLLLCTEYL